MQSNIPKHVQKHINQWKLKPNWVVYTDGSSVQGAEYIQDLEYLIGNWGRKADKGNIYILELVNNEYELHKTLSVTWNNAN